MPLERVATDELDELLAVLPPHVSKSLYQHPERKDLLEIVLDLGRTPEARFLREELSLDANEITIEDLEYVSSHIGAFGADNRAGIERTLHRISAIRNRSGKIVGLTLRVGRAVFGTVNIIQDLVESGKSVLLLGRPGVGKTTMLREVARVLADNLKKRVIVVDTSNEIAGDGDIPHPAIGHARRMQVATPSMQHAVMIEAVENHMPQVIVIDEIGTELEALAARTIAERGVQLVGTAHGNTLENLILNPTLTDLIGGIQSVTLGDEEAKRRGTQKSILERKAPPTFEVIVEIQDWDHVTVHPDVGSAVDSILRGEPPEAEDRWTDETTVKIKKERVVSPPAVVEDTTESFSPDRPPKLYLFGVNRARLEDVAKEHRVMPDVVSDLRQATMLVTTRNYYRRKPQKIRDAESWGIPVYVVKSNNPPHIGQLLNDVYLSHAGAVSQALKEVKDAINEISRSGKPVELTPQTAHVRRLQHMLAEKHDLASQSVGREPERHLVVSPKNPNY